MTTQQVQQPNMDFMWNGAEAQDPDSGGGGQYFEPGHYVVKILSAKVQKAQEGCDMHIIETEIIESDNPELKPGDVVSDVVKWENAQYRSTYQKLLKGFIRAVGQNFNPAFEHTMITGEHFKQMFGQPQGAAGQILKVHCYMGQNKEKEKRPRKKWYPHHHKWTGQESTKGAI